MNCDLTNICDGALPPILGEVKVTVDAKCKGFTRMTSLGVDFSCLVIALYSGPGGSRCTYTHKNVCFLF